MFLRLNQESVNILSFLSSKLSIFSIILPLLSYSKISSYAQFSVGTDILHPSLTELIYLNFALPMSSSFFNKDGLTLKRPKTRSICGTGGDIDVVDAYSSYEVVLPDGPFHLDLL